MKENTNKSINKSKFTKGQKLAVGIASGVLALGLIGGGIYIANYQGETTTIVTNDESSGATSTELTDGKTKLHPAVRIPLLEQLLERLQLIRPIQ